ncbi:MAG: VWA domain-containing protein [Pirellulales bacterium]|nr:VWA domain-containing protein [Pirellulales bacterium]
MNRRSVQFAAFLVLLAPVCAQAQGILVVENVAERVRLPRPIIIWPPHPPRPVPPPPISYKIKELDVQARLIDQVAQVQVSQTFVNDGRQPLEVSFVFPLPYDGAVEQMTLLVDGKEYPARLLDAKEARRMYEEIVRRNHDPALLEWMGTGLFRTSVFPVPPGESRAVSLRYSQLLRKHQGLTDFLFPLSTAKYTSTPPEKVSIRATIESADPIKNVYSPTHAVEIARPDERHATIIYESKNRVPTSDFRLFYDVGRGNLSTRVLSYRPGAGEDGYFLLLASPRIEADARQRPAKTVVLVIDRSGSMSGKKIEQVRDALKYVLNNLRQGDLFNIVAYDSAVETFRPELQRFDEQSRAAALGFVESIFAGGSTDIDAALRTAFGQLQDAARPSYVVFLTDGLPTAGEVNEMKIVENARGYNAVRARLFVFGAGYDVNSRLLDKLARANFGQSEFVRPDENIEASIGKLYNRIESPVMTGVRLQFVFDEMSGGEYAPPINRVYPKESFDLFAGEQLLLVGRYRRSGAAKVTVEGTVGGKPHKLDFPAALAERSNDESFAFIEKLWVVRRIGEIIDELDLKGKNDELIKELVELSTRHGILTHYTSFMADDSVDLRDVASNARRAEKRLDALGEASGRGGFNQRAMKGSFQKAQQAPAAAMPREADAAGTPFAGEVASEAQQAAETVRNIGNRTFFRREGQWIDSRLNEEQEKNARKVKQFSDEYFALAAAGGRELAQYMVFDEPLLLEIDGQAYLIEP